MHEQQLQEVYEMVDSIPFSRAKKNIHRDFADGVMMAELIYHYNQKLVALHNYPPANSVAKKIENWSTLSKQDIENIANAVPGVIEEVLYNLLLKFERPEDEGSLSENAKKIKAKERTPRKKNEQQDTRSIHDSEEAAQQKNTRVDAEAEEILMLVEKIDSASAELQRLQEMSKNKDEVIRNLEKKLEKILWVLNSSHFEDLGSFFATSPSFFAQQKHY